MNRPYETLLRTPTYVKEIPDKRKREKEAEKIFEDTWLETSQI